MSEKTRLSVYRCRTKASLSAETSFLHAFHAHRGSRGSLMVSLIFESQTLRTGGHLDVYLSQFHNNKHILHKACNSSPAEISQAELEQLQEGRPLAQVHQSKKRFSAATAATNFAAMMADWLTTRHEKANANCDLQCIWLQGGEEGEGGKGKGGGWGQLDTKRVQRARLGKSSAPIAQD